MAENYLERSVSEFLNRNKNLGWAIFSTKLVLSFFIISLLFGGWLYLYLSDPVRTDFYMKPFAEGFISGVQDGYKDYEAYGRGTSNYLMKTSWYKYTEETKRLQLLSLQLTLRKH